MLKEEKVLRNKKAMERTGLICVAVASDPAASQSMADVLSAAQQSEAAADVMEIRLDSIVQPNLALFIKELGIPLLFTNRPSWEGGFYSGEEAERIEMLLKAIESGAQYVDIELETEKFLRQQVIDKARQSQTLVITSWHNFEETPSTRILETVFAEQHASGAHIGKIVTMAHGVADVLRVLNLQILAAEKEFPLIAFCMGDYGIISRVATLELGGYMTYGAADGLKVTAPGQLKVSVLRSIMQTIEENKNV